MTRPASSQVMSPIRAPRSTDMASGVEDTTDRDEDEVSTNHD